MRNLLSAELEASLSRDVQKEMMLTLGFQNLTLQQYRARYLAIMRQKKLELQKQKSQMRQIGRGTVLEKIIGRDLNDLFKMRLSRQGMIRLLNAIKNLMRNPYDLNFRDLENIPIARLPMNLRRLVLMVINLKLHHWTMMLNRERDRMLKIQNERDNLKIQRSTMILQNPNQNVLDRDMGLGKNFAN